MGSHPPVTAAAAAASACGASAVQLQVLGSAGDAFWQDNEVGQ
jgi:hypothetical protein